MSISFIASATGRADGYGTSLSTSSTLNIAAGDILIAHVGWEAGASAVTGLSDGGSNTFTRLTENYAGSQGAQHGYILSASANSTATITVTTASRNYRQLIVLQFRPDAGETVTLDDSASSSGTGTSLSSGAVDTTGTDEVVCGGAKSYSSGAFTTHAVGGATADGVVTNYLSTTWYEFFSSTQSAISATVTGPNAAWVCNAIAIKSDPASTPSLVILSSAAIQSILSR